jgi:uncharacterized membrane protein
MTMNQGLTLLIGVGIGAGLAYLLDSERGHRRRALMRDQGVHLLRTTDGALSKATEDLGNRVQGLMAEAGARARHEAVDDVILVERVRSRIGRAVSHPGAIEVSADGGRVTLRGPVLASEVNGLIGAVRRTRGVTDVENHLAVHQRAGDVSGLQGPARRSGQRFESTPGLWSPGERLVGVGVGAALAGIGASRRDPLGTLVAAGGLILLARGLTNADPARLVGVGGGRAGIEFHKTITINAPVEEVFAFWTNVDNFPRFMAHVREVRDDGQGRSRWKVVGPAGTTVEWEAEITQLIPNRILAWKSVDGAAIRNIGVIHFEPAPNDGARLDIRLAYNPPAGALGHAVAALFGADPKRAMDEDLVRLKSLIEDGKTSTAGQTVTRAEVAGPPAVH